MLLSANGERQDCDERPPQLRETGWEVSDFGSYCLTQRPQYGGSVVSRGSSTAPPAVKW